MTDFDLTGIRGAVELFQKDVRLTRDLAGAHGATRPPSLVALAEAALGEFGSDS